MTRIPEQDVDPGPRCTHGRGVRRVSTSCSLLSSGGRGKDPREYLRGEGRNNAARRQRKLPVGPVPRSIDSVSHALHPIAPAVAGFIDDLTVLDRAAPSHEPRLDLCHLAIRAIERALGGARMLEAQGAAARPRSAA